MHCQGACGSVPVGHTRFSWESQGATTPIGHTAFSWGGSAAQKAPVGAGPAAEQIEEHGPHGLEEGQRVRVRGLQKKPQFNGCVGTIDRALDPFGMGRVAVLLDAGNELSLKASNLEIGCMLCGAVFGEGNLALCPTCEHVWTCAACKPQHTCVDQNGSVGVIISDSKGCLTIQRVSPSSPAAEAGIKVGDVILAIDGVTVTDPVTMRSTDPNHHPPIRGQVGSDVTLTVQRQGRWVSQVLVFTMRRGREPKSAAMSAAMPGVKVLSLLSQGPKGCVYKVEMSGEGTTRTGLMNFDMATGKGEIIMPSEEGEDPPFQGGPVEMALDDCYARGAKIQQLIDARKYGAVASKEEEIRSIVTKLEETRALMSEKAKQREVDSVATDLMNGLAVGLQSQHRHRESIVAGKHALRLAERARDDEAIGYCLSGLGDALDSSGMYKEAIEAYEKGLAIAKKQKSMDECFARIHKIAVTHNNNNNPQAARRAYQEIVQFARANGVSPEQAAWMQSTIDQVCP